MTNHSEFTDRTLASFRSRVAQRQSLLNLAVEDVETLTKVGAIDSFVATFLERDTDLLDAMVDRLVHGDEAFTRQVESSSDPLEYTDHNGCLWLFDTRQPHKGWV